LSNPFTSPPVALNVASLISAVVSVLVSTMSVLSSDESISLVPIAPAATIGEG
jgi:hypothetical protein